MLSLLCRQQAAVFKLACYPPDWPTGFRRMLVRRRQVFQSCGAAFSPFWSHEQGKHLHQLTVQFCFCHDVYVDPSAGGGARFLERRSLDRSIAEVCRRFCGALQNQRYFARGRRPSEWRNRVAALYDHDSKGYKIGWQRDSGLI